MQAQKQMIARLEREKKKLAVRRDALRDLADEYAELVSNSDDAIDSLEYAIDALSRLV